MMMIEARRAERIRSLLRARIIFNNGNSTIECIIKNISATGAKIELDTGMSIPELFQLEIPQKGRTYRAKLSWRDTRAIGVEFVTDEPPAFDATRQTIDRLESENRRLRASVAQLTKRLEELGQDASAT